MFEKIKNNILTFIMILIALAFILSGCHHHHGGNTPPATDNPASYSYSAALVAQHQPGFFSCANFNGRVLLGTYQDYSHKMHCQLCELVGNKVNVLHTFEGESVYHIRAFPGYVVLPIEQGNLYRWDGAGAPTMLMHKRYHMGFYDFLFIGPDWYAVEKENVHPPSKVAIWKNGQDWFHSTAWKSKDLMTMAGKLFTSATSLNNRTEAAIIEIDPATKIEKRYKSFRWCWTGCLNTIDDAVWTCFDCGGTFTNTKGEEFHLGDHGWYIGKIGDTIFATTGGKWRGVGPSHLFVFNLVTRQFEKKLDLPICEPWYMCKGKNTNEWYLVGRCEAGNIGKVFLITRTK